MQALDFVILTACMLGVLAVGACFLRRQSHPDEYFVADRRMSGSHIALSVVATDVGGGFSIGLGGPGFAMGLTGSWLLFSGLLGAWLSAVFLIPTVKRLGDRLGWSSFPDFPEHRYDGRTRLAAVVSAVGYGGFVGAQILAGAKLRAVAFGIEQTVAAAIMSTADSCLLASVGNVVHGLYVRHVRRGACVAHTLAVSRVLTIVIGGLSMSIALIVPKVLDATCCPTRSSCPGCSFPPWRRCSGGGPRRQPLWARRWPAVAVPSRCRSDPPGTPPANRRFWPSRLLSPSSSC